MPGPDLRLVALFAGSTDRAGVGGAVCSMLVAGRRAQAAAGKVRRRATGLGGVLLAGQRAEHPASRIA